MSHARTLAKLEQAEFAGALSRCGSPATKNMVSKWETATGRIPAYALVAAARVARVTVSELLRAVGIEQHEPGPTVQSLQRRQEMIEEALNELRAYRGLPPLPVIDEEAVD